MKSCQIKVLLYYILVYFSNKSTFLVSTIFVTSRKHKSNKNKKMSARNSGILTDSQQVLRICGL